MIALAQRGGIKLCVPALVLTEYENLRKTRANATIEELSSSLKKAYDHLQLEPVYVPSAEEIVEPLVEELATTATVIALHPDDAVEALHREAARIRPARGGSGARDAGIWLTVVRHHRSSGVQGVFVTTNTDDFADDTDKRRPHHQLLEDLDSTGDRFQFVFKPFDFLQEIAPAADKSKALAAGVEKDPDVVSELARVLTDSHVFTLEESGRQGEGDLSIWEAVPPSFVVMRLEPLKAHELDDGVLVLVRATTDVGLANSGTSVLVEILAWLEVTDDGSTIVEVEEVRRDLPQPDLSS